MGLIHGSKPPPSAEGRHKKKPPGASARAEVGSSNLLEISRRVGAPGERHDSYRWDCSSRLGKASNNSASWAEYNTAWGLCEHRPDQPPAAWRRIDFPAQASIL